MRWLVSIGLLALPACQRMATPDPDLPPARVNREGHPPSGCNLAPEADCGSGSQPRMTEREWSESTFDAMFRRSAAGTVAVDRTGDGTRMLPDCKLDGAYTEVVGERGSGRFWATNRIVFRPDEVSRACDTATHVVAAFTVTGGPYTGAPSEKTGPFRFSALLFPLPCPPSSSEAKAPGCLGRGLSGPERRQRAMGLLQSIEADRSHPHDLAALYEIYVLLPDGGRSFGFVRGVAFTRAHTDCYLANQMVHAWGSLPPSQWAVFSETNGESCSQQPPFMTCFPGLFDPAPGAKSCFRSVHGAP